MTGTEVNTTLWYTVTGIPLTGVTVQASPAPPQMADMPITFTATAMGGTGVQYQFWLYNPACDPAWSQLQAYSVSPAYNWTPGMPGNYLLSVTAMDGVTGAEVNTTLWYTITGIPLTGVKVQASPASPQMVETPITFTATATGGTNVQYQFWLYNPAATPAWSLLQAYSPAAACPWTPNMPGNYLLSATALDGATGSEVNTTLWYTVTGVPLTGVTVQASPASPQMVDMPITFTATATGGTNVQYQFWLYNPSANQAWSLLQAYSPVATCPWTPSVPGVYLLSATARDGITGTEVNAMLWYAVLTCAPLTAVSVTPSLPSPQAAGTPITFTATATGGMSVQYQFWLYNPNATPAWSCLQAYSTLDTCNWTPDNTGDYLLSVTAQDGVTGAEVNTTMWYTIEE